ncbi:hypothetical protein CK203_055973 [Vitis vinifera]|uniref:Endonuclease/exonuclease/phosphatase domain-containing protein n=1 Tax=Vitis vinifera TaxID=29760 RepID=A0A438GPU1_VITVI|nr:hypothetical protein CK203_055973 [Vitis vinifera]
MTEDVGDFGVGAGQFSLSCRFRNVENTVWVFTGFMAFTKGSGVLVGRDWGDQRSMGRPVIVDEVGLMDIPLQGGVFTWSGGSNNQTWARLDRFLVNSSWLISSVACFRRLPRPLSDHFPVVLEGGGLRRGPLL